MQQIPSYIWYSYDSLEGCVTNEYDSLEGCVTKVLSFVKVIAVNVCVAFRRKVPPQEDS